MHSLRFWFLIVLKEDWGRRAEMRLVTCYNGKDKSGQDGTIINVQWSRPDQQIWKTVKLSLFAVQLNNTPSLQNTIEIKILIFSLSRSIIKGNTTQTILIPWIKSPVVNDILARFTKNKDLSVPSHLILSVTKFPRYPCSAHPSLKTISRQESHFTQYRNSILWWDEIWEVRSGSNPTPLICI